MLSPEIQLTLAEIRAKVRDGTVTREELREGIRQLREGRPAAGAASSKAKAARAAKPTVSSDDLLSELGGL